MFRWSWEKIPRKAWPNIRKLAIVGPLGFWQQWKESHCVKWKGDEQYSCFQPFRLVELDNQRLALLWKILQAKENRLFLIDIHVIYARILIWKKIDFLSLLLLLLFFLLEILCIFDLIPQNRHENPWSSFRIIVNFFQMATYSCKIYSKFSTYIHIAVGVKPSAFFWKSWCQDQWKESSIKLSSRWKHQCYDPTFWLIVGCTQILLSRINYDNLDIFRVSITLLRRRALRKD